MIGVPNVQPNDSTPAPQFEDVSIKEYQPKLKTFERNVIHE